MNPTPPFSAVRDTQHDTWEAIDALGRCLPGYDQVGPPRPDRTVGIFYFLWLGAHEQDGPRDVSKILVQNPAAMTNPDSPRWGPPHAYHHWGEPLLGYYRTDDRCVLRKHAQLLCDAGIDMVVFDVTNQLTYRDYYMVLLEEWTVVRNSGGRTPQVAFLCPFGAPQKVAVELFNDLYLPGIYPDLWFRWDGKPLLLADPDLFTDTADTTGQAPPIAQMREFFTFRAPQPSYFEGPKKTNMWSWLEVFPQHLFCNDRGEKEQMSVGVAQNAVDGRLGCLSEPGARGRSFTAAGGDRSAEPGATARGLNFQEQFERAIAEDPRLIFVTGWNEWIAGRFNEFNGVRLPVMFVDQFDQEHSRDIEPMQGGHGDAYYYQLVSLVRRYKGVRQQPLAGPQRTIDLAGSFRQWDDILPEYLDDIGDPTQRDHPGYNNHCHYHNNTGRNDLTVLKVAHDAHYVRFYARCAAAITPRQGDAWMNLLLGTGTGPSWEGFNLLINRTGDATSSVVERSVGGWTWNSIGRADLRYEGSELMLALPRALLAPDGAALDFTFKWSDNVLLASDVMAFYTSGDTAPSARFRYRYRER